MPAEDPIAAMQQEVSELRDLIQQLIDGQAAIIESLVDGGGGTPASAESAPPPADMPPPPADMPPPPADMPPPPQGDHNEMLDMIQQGLRA